MADDLALESLFPTLGTWFEAPDPNKPDPTAIHRTAIVSRADDTGGITVTFEPPVASGGTGPATAPSPVLLVMHYRSPTPMEAIKEKAITNIANSASSCCALLVNRPTAASPLEVKQTHALAKTSGIRVFGLALDGGWKQFIRSKDDVKLLFDYFLSGSSPVWPPPHRRLQELLGSDDIFRLLALRLALEVARTALAGSAGVPEVDRTALLSPISRLTIAEEDNLNRLLNRIETLKNEGSADQLQGVVAEALKEIEGLV